MTAGYAGHAGKVLAVTQNYKDSILVDRDENAVKYLREKYPLDESKLDILQMDFYKRGYITKFELCRNVFIRNIVRLFPNSIRKQIYQRKMREDVEVKRAK